MRRPKNRDEIIYRRMNRTDHKEGQDRRINTTIEAYGDLYEHEITYYGIYDEDGKYQTPYGGRIEVLTNKANEGILEMMKDYIEGCDIDTTNVDLAIKPFDEGAAYLQITTFEHEALERIENRLYYLYISLDALVDGKI